MRLSEEAKKQIERDWPRGREIVAFLEAQPETNASDDDSPPLSAYDLASEEGRREFLWRFSELDAEAVFEAVQKVWAQLNEPKAARILAMTRACGESGTGKVGLRKVLLQFLDDFNAIDVPELPVRKNFPDSESWHVAVSAQFGRGDAEMAAVLDKWEAILDGRGYKSALRKTAVMAGRWGKSGKNSCRPRTDAPNLMSRGAPDWARKYQHIDRLP